MLRDIDFIIFKLLRNHVFHSRDIQYILISAKYQD